MVCYLISVMGLKFKKKKGIILYRYIVDITKSISNLHLLKMIGNAHKIVLCMLKSFTACGPNEIVLLRYQLMTLVYCENNFFYKKNYKSFNNLFF